jgi:phosphoribosylformylglycinamidine synthase
VGEAVRNVVVTGAVPIAATDCLNYGNPEVPEVFWQFRRGVEGIAEACSRLGISGNGEDPLPIVSGNVSFYNQSAAGRSIPPSPIVAVFGRLDDFTEACDMALRGAGNVILLVGKREDELGGSLYYRTCLGHNGGAVPDFRGELESEMARFVLHMIHSGLVESAHDISEGGLAMAATEMALATSGSSRLGAVLDAAPDPVLLYSETPGYLLEVSPEVYDSIRADLPGFVSVAGRVSPSFGLSGEGWTLDLSTVEGVYSDLLASVVWREEGV